MNETYTGQEMGDPPRPEKETNIEWPARILAAVIIVGIGFCIYKKLFP